jgi:SAM-dependent methyltransferase
VSFDRSSSRVPEPRAEKYWNSRDIVEEYTLEPFLYPGERFALNRYYPNGLASVRVLDLGCGSGRSTRILKQMGADVVGVDISSGLISAAKSAAPEIEFVVADAQQLPFEDESFDTVMFSFNGLDYVNPRQRRTKAVQEIHRVLKAAGIFMVSHHNSAALLFGMRGVMHSKFILFRIKEIISGNAFKREHYFNEPGHPGILTYYCWPNKLIYDMNEAGFSLKSIHPNSHSMEKIDRLFDSAFFTKYTELWYYYVFVKRPV